MLVAIEPASASALPKLRVAAPRRRRYHGSRRRPVRLVLLRATRARRRARVPPLRGPRSPVPPARKIIAKAGDPRGPRRATGGAGGSRGICHAGDDRRTSPLASSRSSSEGFWTRRGDRETDRGPQPFAVAAVVGKTVAIGGVSQAARGRQPAKRRTPSISYDPRRPSRGRKGAARRRRSHDRRDSCGLCRCAASSRRYGDPGGGLGPNAGALPGAPPLTLPGGDSYNARFPWSVEPPNWAGEPK